MKNVSILDLTPKRATLALLFALACSVATAGGRPIDQPPPGFGALFNGKDLSGWRGRQGTYSPYEQATLTPEQLAAKQAAWNADRDAHWRVDLAKGEIVSDGLGVHLVTDNDFDRSKPVLPRGPIELQTHGSEIRFRRIYIREIPGTEPAPRN